jgi:Na+/phosphate symporter
MKIIMLIMQAMLVLLAAIILFAFFVDTRFETFGFSVFGVGLSLLLFWVLNKIKNRWPVSSYLSRFLLCLSYLFCFAGLHQLISYFIYSKGGVIYSLILILVSVIVFFIRVGKKSER